MITSQQNENSPATELQEAFGCMICNQRNNDIATHLEVTEALLVAGDLQAALSSESGRY
mgnify:CR=1 FL=1